MVTPKLEFKNAGLTMLQTKAGILVKQNGREYLAEKWQLSNQVKEIIETAVSNGFTSLWVNGHPSSTNAHYICFSRSHDKPWEFLIGREAKPPNVKCITINKKLRVNLEQLSDNLNWQNFGGKHLFIEPTIDKLLWMLNLIQQIPRETLVTSNVARRLSKTQESAVGFQLEKHLEDYVFEHLLKRGYSPIRQPRAFTSNHAIEQDSIPDILLEVGDCLFVIELKLNATDLADLYQLNRYATNKEIISKHQHKIIKPVLLTGYFHDEIVEEARKFEQDFELVSYNFEDGKVAFRSIMGEGTFFSYLMKAD